MNRSKKAFTLIELLVVIAIIAMLMSILIPSLNRAKNKAQAVICMSNLRNWTTCFTLYANDNNGYYHLGWDGKAENSTWRMWPHVYAKYFNDPKLFFCPTATTGKRSEESGGGGGFGGTFTAWGWTDGIFWMPPLKLKGSTQPQQPRGSYGENTWMCNADEDSFFGNDPVERNNFIRTPNIKNPGQYPLFGDSTWIDNWPNGQIEAPVFPEKITAAGNESLNRYCIDRHMGFVNWCFADSSVKKVGLKYLWRQKWHRRFDKDQPLPQWPQWMIKFSDPPEIN